MTTVLKFVLVGVLFATCSSVCGATTVVRFEFDSLCSQAETIVLARCVDKSSLLDGDRIVTRTRFEVLELVKGTAEPQLVLTLPGGKVEGDRLHIPGIPQFEPGDQLVLFLSKPDARGSPWPMGLGQGCYRAIEEDHQESTILLQRGITPLPDGALSKAVTGKPFKVPLRQFLSQVRRSLAQPTDVR